MRPPIRSSASKIVILLKPCSSSFDAVAIPDGPAPIITILGCLKMLVSSQRLNSM